MFANTIFLLLCILLDIAEIMLTKNNYFFIYDKVICRETLKGVMYLFSIKHIKYIKGLVKTELLSFQLFVFAFSVSFVGLFNLKPSSFIIKWDTNLKCGRDFLYTCLNIFQEAFREIFSSLVITKLSLFLYSLFLVSCLGYIMLTSKPLYWQVIQTLNFVYFPFIHF